jgi:hypothetical protein
MKRSEAYFILVIALSLLIVIHFSVVKGAPPITVQNKASMNSPYATGYANSDFSGRRQNTQYDAEYDTNAGVIYARALATSGSSAWAYAYLEDSFEIIHSSNYRITASYTYRGLAEILENDPEQSGWWGKAKVDLTVYLIDTNNEAIINQTTETIADLTSPQSLVLAGQKEIVLTAILQENHIYAWRAEIRTEASTPSDLVQAIANFFDLNQHYQAGITEVFIEDLNQDHIPPVTTSSLSGTQGENDWYTSNVQISLSAVDDPPGGYGVDFTLKRINQGSWDIYTSPFMIDSEGKNSVEFYSIDKANNNETVKALSVNIDRIPPTGEVTINNGDQYTPSEGIMLSAQAQDGQGSGVSQMRFRNQGDDWEPWIAYSTSSTSWILNTGDGDKRVYAQFKDNAGNVSPETHDDIILDTEPPLATIQINQGDEYTNSTSVTLYLQYSDSQGIQSVRYSNDGVWDTEKWEHPSETKQWTLPSEEGSKTVYAQFRDLANLNSVVISDKIILDTTPPTGTIEINNGASSTASTQVTITPTATDTNGVAKMRLRNDGAEWSDWETVTTKNWMLSSGLGIKTVYAQFKDNAGWISQPYSTTISLVATQPSPTPTSPPPSEKGNVRVYVQDSNKKPINGATVTSTSQPVGQVPLNGTTDSQGAITFKNITTGDYSFRVSKTEFNYNETQTTVGSQEVNSVTITLTAEELNSNSTESWKLIAVVLILINGAALIFFASKRKK